MTDVILVLIYVLLMIVVGSNYAGILSLSKQGKIFKYVMSFLIGNGMTSYIWFVLYRLGVLFSFTSFLISMIIVYLVGYFIKFIYVAPEQILKKNANTKISVWGLLMLIAIVVLGVSSIVFSSYNPISAWDSLTMYDFRAMVIVKTGALNDLFIVPYYTGYPLMTSLMHAAMYLMGIRNPQTIYSVLYIAILFASFYFVRKDTDINRGILVAFLISINSLYFGHSFISYSNLPYSVYFYVAIMLLAVTDDSSFKANTLISAILMALATWIRSAEPFWLVWLFVLFAKAVNLKKLKSTLLPTIVALAIRIDWGVYQHFVNNIMKYEFPSLVRLSPLEATAKLMDNLFKIIQYFIKYQFAPYIYWLLQLANIGNIKRNYLLLVVILSFGLSLAGTAYIAITIPFWQEIGDSSKRMLFFLTPIIMTSILMKNENQT